MKFDLDVYNFFKPTLCATEAVSSEKEKVYVCVSVTSSLLYGLWDRKIIYYINIFRVQG